MSINLREVFEFKKLLEIYLKDTSSFNIKLTA